MKLHLKSMKMKTLNQIKTEIKEISNMHPIMQDRIDALREAGYDTINYVYVKQNTGLYAATHLTKKLIYRIQIGYTELQKGYLAAWCVDVSSIDIVDEVELPF
mgnify:CR=1 FL=1|jgi:hypothetical protein